MPLKSTAPGLDAYPELKHFTWAEVATFSLVDRFMLSYLQKGSGDWKHVKAEGYFLVTVDKNPYWADAIGQIPFAVDYWTDVRTEGGIESDEEATKATLEAAKDYAQGRLFGNKPPDKGHYDEFFNVRGSLWASRRFRVQTTGTGLRVIKRLIETTHPAEKLGEHITATEKATYGL